MSVLKLYSTNNITAAQGDYVPVLGGDKGWIYILVSKD